MQSEELKELFVHELKDLYNAENQLIKALPKMAKAAQSAELKAGLEQHLEETKEHAHRLEQICEQLGESTRGTKCKAMQGLIEEGKDLISEEEDSEAMDAGLICAAQKVEHYEIAGYGTVREWAELLELSDIASLLEKTLKEEKATDEKLTKLAHKVNLVGAAE